MNLKEFMDQVIEDIQDFCDEFNLKITDNKIKRIYEETMKQQNIAIKLDHFRNQIHTIPDIMHVQREEDKTEEPNIPLIDLIDLLKQGIIQNIFEANFRELNINKI